MEEKEVNLFTIIGQLYVNNVVAQQNVADLESKIEKITKAKNSDKKDETQNKTT